MEQLGFTKDQVSFVIMLFAVGEIGGKMLVSAVGHRFPVGLLYTPAASSIFGTTALGVMAACRTFPQMMVLSMCEFGNGLILMNHHGSQRSHPYIPNLPTSLWPDTPLLISVLIY